jgi:sec-independent protein translocase protein TatC
MAGGIALLVDRKRDIKADAIETGSTEIAAPTSISE